MSETPIQPQSWDMILDQYSHGEIFESHGSIERLPKLFRANVMTNIRSLLINYRGAVNFSRGTQSSNALTAKLSAVELFKMGLTLYLPDLRSVMDGANEWLADFEQVIGVPAGSARLGAFVSPAGEGAPCHYDAEEVFSIQLIGEKVFEIAPMTEIENPVGKQYSPGRKPYADLLPQVSTGFPEHSDLKFRQVTMRPGSVLFMPRGTWHRSVAQSDSLAVSVIINPPVLVDVFIEQLRRTLLQYANWRAPMIDANSHMLADALSALPWIIDTLTIESLNDFIASPGEQVESINSNSRFLCRPDARLVLKKGSKDTVLIENRASDGSFVLIAELKFNDEMLKLANWIVQQKAPFIAASIQKEFAALADKQVYGLLRMLLQANVIELLLFPAIQH